MSTHNIHFMIKYYLMPFPCFLIESAKIVADLHVYVMYTDCS